jgi:hypothetical protein
VKSYEASVIEEGPKFSALDLFKFELGVALEKRCHG